MFQARGPKILIISSDTGGGHRSAAAAIVAGVQKFWEGDSHAVRVVRAVEESHHLSPRRIKVSGMPVHPKFELPDERSAQAARRALGLDPEKFTVFVNAGWVGGGNIPQIFRELVRGELDVQAIFLAGRNEELRAEAESLASQAPFPIKVIGYSEHVEQLMSAANVMISKLGGLTTFEALACRIPIIADAITEPMPQEAGTANLIIKRGAGILLRQAKDIVPVIRRMVEDTAHYSAMRAATIGLAIPNATRQIVEEITALLPAPVPSEEEPLLRE